MERSRNQDCSGAHSHRLVAQSAVFQKSAVLDRIGQVFVSQISSQVTTNSVARSLKAFRLSLVLSVTVVLALQCSTATGFTDVDLAVAPTAIDPYVRVYGADNDYRLGYSVAFAGDVNNDGYSDILVGAYLASMPNKTEAGAAYLIFGRPGRTNFTFDTAALTIDTGLKIFGPESSSQFGWSVCSLGDLNKDGYDDFVVGAPYLNPLSRNIAGGAAVIFGKAAASWADIDTSTDLAGAGLGFWIYGAAYGHEAGWSVGAAGDVNKDGNPDIIIGARNVGRDCTDNVGCAYVIFGKGTATTATDIDLAAFTTSSTNGFRVYGIAGQFSISVGGAGDVNDDGYDDVLVGCRLGAVARVLVLFGHSSATPFIDLDLTVTASSYGFPIDFYDGDFVLEQMAVSKAGDVNGDGIDDFVVGSLYSTLDYFSLAAFVIFGRSSGFADIDPYLLSSRGQGFAVRVENAWMGRQLSVSGGVDVNGDGYDDIVVGTRIGAAFVITGHPFDYTFTDIDTASLTSSQGNKILRAEAGDQLGVSVALVPDFNGDGFADVLLGACGAGPMGRNGAGTAYLLYGSISTPTAAPTFAPTTIAPTAVPTNAPTAAHCPVGFFARNESDACKRCPVDTYSDQEGSSTCLKCRFPLGTMDSGSSHCDAVHVGLTDLGGFAVFEVLGGAVLCCLATQSASLTVALVGMVLVSTLDLLTDLVYIVSANFVTGAVFGLCVAFFVLRAGPFVYCLYKMGHWNPCFRASFYSVPERATAGEVTPVTAARMLDMVLLFPLYLACHVAFAVVWLVVGCFLYLTGVMALQRVRVFWVRMWRGEWTTAFTAPAAMEMETPAQRTTGTDPMLLAICIAVPELILQLYNQQKVGYTALGIVSVIASGLVTLSGIGAVVAAASAGKRTPQVVPGADGDKDRAGDYELTAFAEPQATTAVCEATNTAANGLKQQQ